MRLALVLVCLAATSCNVDRDAQNKQVTIEFNEQQARDTANKAGRTVENVAAGVGNVAGAAGRAIKNEVGDIDVDINVNRTRPQNNETR